MTCGYKWLGEVGADKSGACIGMTVSLSLSVSLGSVFLGCQCVCNSYYVTRWCVSQEWCQERYADISWRKVWTQSIDLVLVLSCLGGVLWKGPTRQKQAEQAAGGRIGLIGRRAEPSWEETPDHQLPGPFIWPSTQRLKYIASHQTISGTYVLYTPQFSRIRDVMVHWFKGVHRKNKYSEWLKLVKHWKGIKGGFKKGLTHYFFGS